MIAKQIIFFDEPCTLMCDAKCNKAWGINQRPKISFDENEPDDYAWLADDEVGEGPIDPGTYEGGHAKPTIPEERLNKWCARECERSELVDKKDGVKELKNFDQRVYNQPWKHKE